MVTTGTTSAAAAAAGQRVDYARTPGASTQGAEATEVVETPAGHTATFYSVSRQKSTVGGLALGVCAPDECLDERITLVCLVRRYYFSKVWCEHRLFYCRGPRYNMEGSGAFCWCHSTVATVSDLSIFSRCFSLQCITFTRQCKSCLSCGMNGTRAEPHQLSPSNASNCTSH